MVTFSGASEIVYNFLKLLIALHETFTGLLELIPLYKQYTIETFLYSLFYQNYTLAFIRYFYFQCFVQTRSIICWNVSISSHGNWNLLRKCFSFISIVNSSSVRLEDAATWIVSTPTSCFRTARLLRDWLISDQHKSSCTCSCHWHFVVCPTYSWCITCPFHNVIVLYIQIIFIFQTLIDDLSKTLIFDLAGLK